jgi:hypothetical protein
MTADTDEATGPGNGLYTAPVKRKIANTTIAGAMVTVQFTEAFGGAVVTIDTSKAPDNGLLAAQGAATVIQNAYSATGAREDPVKAAKEAVASLMAGTWMPGPPRSEVLPDPLLVATADHLTKESGKTYSVDQVLETFLPAYQRKHGYDSIGAARRRLRGHPDIARRIAEIEADRAKHARDKVKGTPSESLLDV